MEALVSLKWFSKKKEHEIKFSNGRGKALAKFSDLTLFFVVESLMRKKHSKRHQLRFFDSRGVVRSISITDEVTQIALEDNMEEDFIPHAQQCLVRNVSSPVLKFAHMGCKFHLGTTKSKKKC